MKVKAIKCNNCGDTIYSRAVHDFHWCSCKKCAVDGGLDYFRITGKLKDWKVVDLNVLDDLTDKDARKVLYDDWNTKTDNYGLLKTP